MTSVESTSSFSNSYSSKSEGSHTPKGKSSSLSCSREHILTPFEQFSPLAAMPRSLEQRVIKPLRYSQSGVEVETDSSPKRALLAKLQGGPIYKIVDACKADFKRLASDGILLSDFLSQLLREHRADAVELLALFEKKQCDTPIDLEIVSHDALLKPALAAILAKFPRLQSISLENVALSLEGFEGYLKALQKISLVDVTVGDAELSLLLSQCSSLTELRLKKLFDVSFEEIEDIAPLHSVILLDLDDVEVTDRGLAAIARLFPNLTTLLLAGCKQLTDDGFVTSELSSKVKMLDLTETKISGKGLSNALTRIPLLTTLVLRRFCNSASVSLLAGVTLPPSLQQLDLSYTRAGFADVSKVLTSCPQLDTLYLSGCSLIESQHFKSFSWNSALKKLFLNGTKIDMLGLTHLLQKATALDELDLRNCPNLPAEWQIHLQAEELDQLMQSTIPSTGLERAMFKLEL